MNTEDEEFKAALLELGKITFQSITAKAADIAQGKPANETFLAVMPHEILQGIQAVWGHARMISAKRTAEVYARPEPTEMLTKQIEEENKTPGLIFVLAGLTPPVDPIHVLLDCEVFVAGWKDVFEESSKRPHLGAAELLTKIKEIKEIYKVPKDFSDAKL